MPRPRLLLPAALAALLAITSTTLAWITPSTFAGTWVTDPADPARGGEHELILATDPELPGLLLMRDSTPARTLYHGEYRVEGDRLIRQPNGQADDPYRDLSWRLVDQQFELVHGGVYRPKANLGTRLVRLLPDPFFDLVRAGDIDALRALLDLRAKAIESIDQIGRTAPYVAVLKRQPRVLRLLLDAGVPVDIKNRNLWGDPALFAAVRGGDPECLGILLEHGADVNGRSENGRTPLMAAGETCGYYKKVLEILLMAGADPLARNSQGLTAREILIKSGSRHRALILDRQIAAHQSSAPQR